MASPKISLKLLVDKKGQKVLFAEATKEFADFLFHIFSLPIGTLVELLGSKQMVGCLGKLKESIDNFNGTYLQPGIKKEDILNPKTAYNANTLLLSDDDDASSFQQPNASKDIYCCYQAAQGYGNDHCRGYATLYLDATCPSCKQLMNYKRILVIPNKELKAMEVGKNVNGYVKEVVTYMVMDDLVMNPMSTISSIALINSFGVMDLSQLQELEVSFGRYEALKLLMTSLKTDKVLSTLFLNNHHA
uniref:uncharacterized protein LOC122589448 n=1 Tax=Erigeron canadensis TaxID=72917 RepID=UPI001CB8EFE6|nr:uncharacterized protein LOC122589448 [Erigeron canadensis]